jgi:CHAD domain-containing protein
MSCEAAFRTIARCCLRDLTANHGATCQNDHDALHEMRVALTRLRTATSFFAPMVLDASSDGLKRELKWLNGCLGATRDVDVAIERLKAANGAQAVPNADDPKWEQKSTASHRELTQKLRSAKYRRLMQDLADWIDNGAWSTATTKTAARRRACPIVRYSRRRLTQWHERLLRKASGLEDMGAKKRHRLRLASKRVRYAIEFFEPLRKIG